jgi:hypothetical protein
MSVSLPILDSKVCPLLRQSQKLPLNLQLERSAINGASRPEIKARKASAIQMICQSSALLSMFPKAEDLHRNRRAPGRTGEEISQKLTFKPEQYHIIEYNRP